MQKVGDFQDGAVERFLAVSRGYLLESVIVVDTRGRVGIAPLACVLAPARDAAGQARAAAKGDSLADAGAGSGAGGGSGANGNAGTAAPH